jgi:hypothetical protein
MKIQKIILALVLTLQTIYCWRCLYGAQFLQYDDNYGLMIHAFIISLLTFFSLLLIWFMRRQWIKVNSTSVIVWLFVGSPLTIAIAVLYYQDIFKNSLPGQLSP